MIPMYYHHPDWLKETTRKISMLDRHWVGEPSIDMPDWPWERLVNSGLAFIDHCACGTSEFSLIWGREDVLFADYLEKADEGGILPSHLHWAYVHFVKGDPNGAREIFEQTNGGWEGPPVGITHLVFKDEVASRRMLERVDTAESDVLSLTYVAMFWNGLFSDMERSKDALLLAQKNIREFWDCIHVARKWLTLFQDKTRAERLLEDAEVKPQYPPYQLQLAKCWKKWFNEDDRSVALLRQAESESAKHPLMLRKVAKRWQSLFDNKDEAARLKEQAENIEISS